MNTRKETLCSVWEFCFFSLQMLLKPLSWITVFASDSSVIMIRIRDKRCMIMLRTNPDHFFTDHLSQVSPKTAVLWIALHSHFNRKDLKLGTSVWPLIPEHCNWVTCALFILILRSFIFTCVITGKNKYCTKIPEYMFNHENSKYYTKLNISYLHAINFHC